MKTKTKRRVLLCAVMSVIMAFTMAVPMTASAATNTMPTADSNGVITLTDNVELSSAYTVAPSTTVTINLNGHNITATSSCAIVNKGTLTITGTGTVSASSAAVANWPNATCTLSGGTYESSAWYVIKNMGSMTINSGVTVQKPSGSTNNSSLIDNGWVNSSDEVAGETVTAQADKASLTINGGTFTGGSATKSVVKNDDYGTLTINDGTFKNTNSAATDASVIMNWNVATISGGTFEGSYPITNGYLSDIADKGEITISGGTFTGTSSILGNNSSSKSGSGSVTITGGTFNLSNKATIFGENYGTNNAAYNYTIKVSGGTFSAPVPDSCIDGDKVNLTSDGETFTLGSKDDAMAEVDIEETWKKVGSTTNDATATAAVYFTTREAAEKYATEHKTGSVSLLKAIVTYKLNNSEADKTEIVKVGEKAKGITAPTYKGYTFVGWYTDEALTQKYDFDTALEGDLTLYAGYTKDAAAAASDNSAKTGDDMNPAIWIALAALALAGAGGTVLYSRRKHS